MTLDSTILKALLSKFQQNDFPTLLKSWDCLSDSRIQDIDFTVPRRNVVNSVNQVCLEQNVTDEDVGRLALLYMEKHSEKRLWSVFELKEKRDFRKKTDSISSPGKFCEAFKDQLNLYFECIISVQLINGALWARIHFLENGNKKLSQNRLAYFVHYPQTSLVIMSKIIAKYHDTVMQAIITTLGYDSIVESKLTGHHVASLAKLSLNKNNKGEFTKYKQSKLDRNPLSRASSRKRNASDSDEQDMRISYENEKDVKRRKKTIDDKFGDEQPRLETVEYKMDLKFKGVTDQVPGYSATSPFRCHVKFEGPAVLEGIKNLGKVGLAASPLPRHLQNVNQFGKNQFVLGDKT